jgi:hypothetical protein
MEGEEVKVPLSTAIWKKAVTEACIERPVIIVSTPRAGSTMLFDALAQAPGIFTIGNESHGIIEAIEPLTAARHGFESSRLTAADATPDVAATLHRRFLHQLRDRDGRRAAGTVRMLEKTPRNALRVPFLDAVFPDAFFIYLHRDPYSTISSMLEAWRSQRFVTYSDLPGWLGPPWSLLLVPGWRALNGRPLAEIAATQWTTTTRILLDDLEALPAGRWCAAAYEAIVADPQREVERLCARAGMAWDRQLSAPLPISRTAVTVPDPSKAERNREELDTIRHIVDDVSRRVR